MLFSFGIKNPDLETVHPERMKTVRQVLNEEPEIIDQFTPQSIGRLSLFTSIMTERIADGRNLPRQASLKTSFDESDRIAQELADILETTFDIDIGRSETKALAVFLRSCKQQKAQDSDDFLNEDGRCIPIKAILHEMLAVFDPEIVCDLENDRDFLDGLLTHLRPMIIRLIHGFPAENHLLPEIKTEYPEIYEKALKASVILADRIDTPVPDEEIGYIALHFGTALMRLEEKRHYRKVTVGIVCASGIGISYYIASKMRQHFGQRIETKIMTTADAAEEKTPADFIVSTFSLSETSCQVIQISSIVNPADLDRIEAAVQNAAVSEKKNGPGVSEILRETIDMAKESDSILKGFSVELLPDETTFSEIVASCGEMFGETSEDAAQIVSDIMEREKLATQIVPELELVFLHSTTTGVSDSRFMIFRPEGGCFTGSELNGIRLAILMLLPKKLNRRDPMLGAVSRSIFDDDRFMECLMTETTKTAYDRLENILENRLLEKTQEMNGDQPL